MHVENITFHNSGFLMADVPSELFENLKTEATKIKINFSAAEKHNDSLVGNLEHEYKLPNVDGLSAVTEFLANVHDLHFKGVKNTNNFELYGSWINFQKKHEFNPIHRHSGAFSFVIWLQIPYLKEEEDRQPSSVNARSKVAGSFFVLYSDFLGSLNTHHIPADKTYEGKMILFPSALWHGVNPFYTSDEYRISVSGNIGAKV